MQEAELIKNFGSRFDLYHFGVHIILSLLSFPYDAKCENFILQTESARKIFRFIGIDNDCIFSPLIYKFKENHYPGVRSVLYALPLMHNEIPEILKHQILSLPRSLPFTFLIEFFAVSPANRL